MYSPLRYRSIRRSKTRIPIYLNDASREIDFPDNVKGIEDRDAAAQLTNCEIQVDSTQLPSLEEGDYYWKDLMGCQVVNLEGYEMGKVFAIG